MSTSFSAQLQTAAVSTFEALTYLPAEELLDAPQRSARADAAVRVAFSGPRSGELVVRVSRHLLPAIAANMLGEGELPEASLERDALGELANVICGNVLPAIWGPATVFHLAPPEPLEDPGAVSALGPPAAVAHIGLEDGRVDLFLFAGERRTPAAPTP
jgi:hypothetical protein